MERLSVGKAFEVLKAIEDNGKKDGDLFVYNTGWDDQRIAALAGVHVQSVAYRRKEAFGELRRGSARSDGRFTKLEIQAQSFRVEVADLKTRMDAMEKALNILLQAPNRGALSPDAIEKLKHHFNGQVGAS